jgi:hypothetical protein
VRSNGGVREHHPRIPIANCQASMSSRPSLPPFENTRNLFGGGLWGSISFTKWIAPVAAVVAVV